MDEEIYVGINEFETSYNINEYEVWDEKTKQWTEFSNSCYVSAEFPKPTEAKYPINLITCKDSKTGETRTWGTTQYTGNSPLVKTYHYFVSELDMMISFVRWFRKQRFDFITGWNVQNFDMTYIVNRINILVENDIELHDLALMLSPLKKIKQKRLIHPLTKKHIGHYYEFAGITILDYMDLYKNFTFETLESYSLQFVCQHEIKKGKTELDGAINQIYKTDWNTFVEYNINDVDLVWELDQKKKFINLTISMCADSLIPFDRVCSSIATIEGYILKDMHRNNLLMNDRASHNHDWWHEENMHIVKDKFGLLYYQNCKENEKTFEPFYVKGGHVEAYPGLYKKLEVRDIKSSYPHQVMQYNISPETKVIKPTQEMIDSNTLIKSEINGVYYKRTKNAILPTIVKKIFDERVLFQKLRDEAYKNNDKALGAYYESQQHIRKILINSMYGVLANKYFHFYDVDNARAITRGGRVTVRYIAGCANSYYKDNWHKIGEKVLGTFVPDSSGKPQKLRNDIVVLIDTDSVRGDSVVQLKDKSMKIEDLFDSCDNVMARRENDFIGTFKISPQALSYNKTGKLEYNDVKHIMKHLVKKRMFRIKCGDKFVDCTEDHSVIINRNGDIIDVSPKDIKSGDKIMKI